MPYVFDLDENERLLRPFSGMTDGQLRRGEGFRRDNPQGLFIGESAKVIERALDAGISPLSLLVGKHWLDHDRSLIERILATAPETPVFVVPESRFRSITGYEVVRGALACFERPAPSSPERIIAGSRRLAILEDVGNYTNMGALFRSAAALGVDGVLLSPSCHDPFYRRCARVSMGAVFQVPWARFSSEVHWAQTAVDLLHESGFEVAAMALSDEAESLRESGIGQLPRAAVMLGTEGEGLSAEAITACDKVVRIPMAHGVDSLNVAAAAAIAFWELCA